LLAGRRKEVAGCIRKIIFRKAQMSMKYSVVIPAYNAEATIAASIQSALNQSYQPYEIIVVDDASTDNTPAIIKSFVEPVKYVQLIQNNGPSVARNKGIDMAKGDYIAFLDHDDLWHKDKLALINSILEAQPQIDFIYHPFTLEDIDTIKLPESGTVFRMPFMKLLSRNVIGTPCVVMKRSIPQRFEPTMRYMEDYDLWLRIGYKYKLHFINIPLTQILRPVLSQGGLSSNKWKMRRGEMRAYRRLVRLNPLFVLLLPFLLFGSLLKQIGKMFSK
jgi:glycosyltransferase involved in cell wall biosynthesis